MAAGGHRAANRIGDLRFDAGGLALNLVATVGRRFGEPVERLASVERLREWLAGVDLEAGIELSAHERRPRRWCSSERCGNRVRVAAHRARLGGAGGR